MSTLSVGDRVQADNVNSPAHYRQGGMEVIDAIEGMALPFHEGNIVKYVARWKFKGGVEDLKKARWYLDRLIAKETASPDGATGCPQNTT